jgi:hypothetical protein
MLEENSPLQPHTHRRNIQMGKSRKKTLSPRKVPNGKNIPTAAPYLGKEHREGKNGEKILVPVRFFGGGGRQTLKGPQ